MAGRMPGRCAHRAPEAIPPPAGPSGTVNDTLEEGCDSQGRRLAIAGAAAAILAPVGLNPFRPQQRSIADYVMVAGAVVVCVALLLWAAFG